VTPIVGWVEPPFDLRPDPFEVADVFEVPLEFFLDPVNHQRHSDVFNGRTATSIRWLTGIVTSGAPPRGCLRALPDSHRQVLSDGKGREAERSEEQKRVLRKDRLDFSSL